MADKVYQDPVTGIKRRLRDIGDGFYADEIAIASAIDPAAVTLMGSIAQNWRADFIGVAGPLDGAKWRDTSVTPGTSTAGIDGNGNLVITTGVGINQERIIETIPVFSVGMLARFALMISQRTANQEFRVEIVSATLQPDGSYTTDEDSRASWALLGSDTTVQGRYEVGVGLTRGGLVQQSAVATITNPVATQIFEITYTNDEASFSQRAIDSTAVRIQQYVKTQNLPDPSKMYRLRIRAKNLGVAPASSTTMTLAFVSCTDYNELMTEITGGRGDQQPGTGVPVNVAGGVLPTVTTLTTVTSSPNTGIAAPSTSASTSPAGTAVKVNSAASTNATSTKATVGKFLGLFLANNGAAARYFKIFNKATAPTLGTDIPIMIFMIPPGGAISFAPTVAPPLSTGFAWAITAGAADTDATAIGANEVVGHLHYV